MRKVLALVLFLALTPAAFADSLAGIDPPSGLIVTRGPLEWVWAAPVAPDGSFGGLPLVLHHGWSIPTLADWLASFADPADVHAAFHAPDGSQRCSAPYFGGDGYDHCDSGDLFIALWHAPDTGAWAGNTFSQHPAAETLLVRGERTPGVPEPATLSLLALGLLGLAAGSRKKQ